MAILAIEIEVNGERLAVAGANNLSMLAAQVLAGVGAERRSLEVDDHFRLLVTALTSPESTLPVASPSWIKERTLRVGDTVTFRIVDVEQGDPPLEVLPVPTPDELASATERES